MSSESESDEEYVPGKPEKLSEEESADEETDLQYDNELEQKAKKRKALITTKSKGCANKRTRKGKKEVEEEPLTNNVEEPKDELDPEEEKKKEDDLWAMFLDGTDTKVKQSTKKDDNKNEQAVRSDVSSNSTSTQKEVKSTDDNKERERRIFEFAGETIVVENNVIKEKIKTADAPLSEASKFEGPSKGRTSGGLSEVLGQLNKKTKLSTLEKTKLDWITYKKQKGLEEEIHNHNKGKAGFLDRQDFLERADHRQYEIERNLRLSRRSNR